MKIFEPIQVKKVVFQNRIVMAPMVPFGIPERSDGVISDELLEHYLSRADNDMGLLIVQALAVTPTDSSINGVGVYRTGIFSDEHKTPLKAIADTFHAHGSKVFVQLGFPSRDFDSGASINGYTTAEMQHIRNAFIDAARRCKEAGCDGVELHGAHGFFLNMVTSEQSNQRKDSYGGNFEHRIRFVREIVAQIKEIAGDDFIIAYRMGWCSPAESDVRMAQTLEELGVDMLHVSSGIPSAREISLPSDFPFNAVVYAGIKIKEAVQIPVIVVNDIQTLQRAEQLIENGMADFAAFGRPFLADENFIRHSVENKGYHSCFRCRECKWLEHYEKCPAYKNKKMERKDIL